MSAERSYIVLDAPTREFLRGLRELRKKAGLSQQALSAELGIDQKAIYAYEHGLRRPTLGMLMRMAEYFGYDLSASVNYKVYRGELSPSALKRKLRKYSLTYPELSSLTGYSEVRIRNTVNMYGTGNAECLFAVLEVLRQERELERFRTKGVLSGYCGGGR